MTDYPEHEKLKALGGANQIVGDFIEWLGEQGWELAHYPQREDGTYRDTLWPVNKGRDTLISEFFEIDQVRLDAEKRAMLDTIRG